MVQITFSPISDLPATLSHIFPFLTPSLFFFSVIIIYNRQSIIHYPNFQYPNFTIAHFWSLIPSELLISAFFVVFISVFVHYLKFVHRQPSIFSSEGQIELLMVFENIWYLMSEIRTKVVFVDGRQSSSIDIIEKIVKNLINRAVGQWTSKKIKLWLFCHSITISNNLNSDICSYDVLMNKIAYNKDKKIIS